MGQYDYQGNPPKFTGASIAKYLRRRPITLVPDPLPHDVEFSNGKAATKSQLLLNPFVSLGLMTRKNWLFFSVAFLTWSWDAFDFFSVSLTTTEIAKSLDRPVKDITWGITLVLMLRSVGSIIFGIPADKYGRKWPFVINCLVFIATQLGTGFVTTYNQFLGVRALLGVAMGGIYGNVAATALEDCPPECRGIISGLFQLGYSFGYLLCVVFNQALTYNTSHGWRSLFWFGSGPTVLLIIFRLCLPETDTFIAQQRIKASQPEITFGARAKKAAKKYWITFIYLVLFTAGMNFMSHGSQDLYPTFLKTQLGFSHNAATVTNCVANFGAITGAFFLGHISQFAGRRLTLIGACCLGGALVYPWIYSRGSAGVNASVFFFQFAVQGAWATVPIYCSELSPPEFRSLIVGSAYQFGNLASSASSTIEARIGSRFPLYDSKGNPIPGKYDYGKVMAIFLGCVFAYVLIVSFFGPERRHVSFISDDIHDTEGKLPEDFEKEEVQMNEYVPSDPLDQKHPSNRV